MARLCLVLAVHARPKSTSSVRCQLSAVSKTPRPRRSHPEQPHIVPSAPSPNGSCHPDSRVFLRGGGISVSSATARQPSLCAPSGRHPLEDKLQRHLNPPRSISRIGFQKVPRLLVVSRIGSVTHRRGTLHKSCGADHHAVRRDLDPLVIAVEQIERGA